MKIFIKLVLLVGIIVYLVFAFADFTTHGDNTLCKNVSVTIADSSHAGFITAEEVDRLLHQSGLYPVGRTMKQIDGNAIEKTLRKNTFIDSVSVYKSPNGVLNVLVLQRLPEAVKATGLKRPELSYYASQQALIAAQRKQLNTQLRPTLGFFGTGLIHSKVSEWVNQGMLMGGVSLKWNLSALYTRKNDLRKLDTQTSLYESQQEVFVFNNRLQNEEAEGAISSLRKQLAHDNEIVRLRQSIRNRSEQKVKLGTESVNELLRHINAVNQAQAQQAMHKLQLLKEQYNQNDINGL